MKKIASTLALLFCAGCAAMPFGVLETGSTLISLGSLGQTAVQATRLASKDGKLSAAYLPPQYAEDTDRMLREAWEQNYQLAKIAQWEGEDVSWRELGTTVARKAEGGNFLLVLVRKSFARNSAVSETVTVYATPSGRILRDPSESPGESFYPKAQERKTPVRIYAYTAYFFTRSRQPSGILAADGPWDGPCRTAYAYGALVLAVGKKTPADDARLQAGEIITAINGRSVDYQTLFALLRPGENTLNICRDGRYATKRLLLPDHTPTGPTTGDSNRR
jgi:hypothetical protein